MMKSAFLYDQENHILCYLDENEELTIVPTLSKETGQFKLFHHIDSSYNMVWYSLDDKPRLYFEHLRNVLKETLIHD